MLLLLFTVVSGVVADTPPGASEPTSTHETASGLSEAITRAKPTGAFAKTAQIPGVYAPGLTGAVLAVAAGDHHTCALTSTGGVKCWGHNASGQLGNGTAISPGTILSNSTPVDVIGLGSGVIAIAVGGDHTCALLSSGGVKCWGDNTYGQLGNGGLGASQSSSVPVAVQGLASGVTAVVAGQAHTCAVLASGMLKCWGDNYSGQLGNGSAGPGQHSAAPVTVQGLGGGTVAAVALGAMHTCALTGAGGIMCWGNNTYGQLGNGSSGFGQYSTTPVNVTGLTNGLVAVVAGDNHTCALTNPGGVKCWGRNEAGQLGNATSGMGADSSVPVNVLTSAGGPPLADVRVLSGGSSHTCAAMGAGGVKCWGSNSDGQLGNHSLTNSSIPVDVVGSPLASASKAAQSSPTALTGLVSVEAGGTHTCALSNVAGVICWGSNLDGQLGDPQAGNQSRSPVYVIGLSSNVVQVSVGVWHACALLSDGRVKCWGSNQFGQLGNGFVSGVNEMPVFVIDSTTNRQLENIVQIAAGGDHTCAVTATGEVKCWGANYNGQLGDDTTIQRTRAVNVLFLQSAVSMVSTGDSHTCAVLTGGGLKCWGANYAGQLGDGTTLDRYRPVDVNTNISAVSVSAGNAFTCALFIQNGVKCWGSNNSGQLGNGGTVRSLVPVDVVGFSGVPVAVTAGGAQACALMSASGVQCWGNNDSGELGTGTWLNSSMPVDVAAPNQVGTLTGVVKVEAGYFHTCAVTNTATVLCWGNNYLGQLGVPAIPTYSPFPVPVPLAPPMQAVSAGGFSTCALSNTGGVTCWGSNIYGQLGAGVMTFSPIPVDLRKTNSPLSTGVGSTCLVTGVGRLVCWGSNNEGQLGNPSAGSSSPTPVDVMDDGGVTPLANAETVAVGKAHACALTDSGVVCWGSGMTAAGMSAPRSPNSVASPTDLIALAGTAVAISAGDDHTCALMADGSVKCWGSNSAGQLGNPAAGSGSLSPVIVLNQDNTVLTGVIALASGEAHTCAVTSNGRVKCWGSNSAGQLGNPGAGAGSQTAVEVQTGVNGAALGDAIAVTAGGAHSCAVTWSGQASCWGSNAAGQLGQPSVVGMSGRAVRVVVVPDGPPLMDIISMSAGSAHTCALIAGGMVKCWGSNAAGQVGAPVGATAPTPVDVTGLASGVVAMAAGAQHTCALLGTNVVKCWGSNSGGQLGSTGPGGPNPVTVSGLTLPLAFTGSSIGTNVSAVLNGQVTPFNAQGSYLFQYGQSFGYGQASTSISVTGSTPTAVLVALNGLNQGPYHYRTQVQNNAWVGLGLNRWVQITAEPTNVILREFNGAASGNTVTLTWSTSFEVDVMGFRLYRSLQASDGYQGVGPELIPSLLEPAGVAYSWTDMDLAAGGWYYIIEAISSSGQTLDAAGPVFVQTQAVQVYRLFLPLIVQRD